MDVTAYPTYKEVVALLRTAGELQDEARAMLLLARQEYREGFVGDGVLLAAKDRYTAACKEWSDLAELAEKVELYELESDSVEMAETEARLRNYGFIYQTLGGPCDCYEMLDNEMIPTVTRLYLDVDGFCEPNTPNERSDRTWIVSGSPEQAEEGELVGHNDNTLGQILDLLDAGWCLDEIINGRV